MAEDAPAGFERHFRQSPLTDPWEPLWSRRDGNRFRLGARIASPHCNARGFAHGGLIAALADNAMGLACVLKSGNPGALTASLSLDFIGVASVGQWLEVAATPLKLGRALAFAEAHVTADGALVARASAVFRLAESRPEERR